MENTLTLRTWNDLDAYHDAVEAFADGGGKAELMERLMGLGVPAPVIRWHGEYPGRAMVAICNDTPYP